MVSTQNSAERAAQWCAIGLGFFAPISTALDSVLLVAFVILWFSGGHLRERLRRLVGNPVALVSMIFAGTIFLGMTWSSAPIEHVRDTTVDALRILVLGLFSVVFLDSSTRDRAQFAFLLSSTLILILSYALWAGIGDSVPGLKGRHDYPIPFKDHFTHDAFMAIAAVLFALHAMEARSRRVRMLLGALAVAAVIEVFFLAPGSAGQLPMAAGIAYLAIARLSRKLSAVVAGVCVTSIAAVVWFSPSAVPFLQSFTPWHESQALETRETHPENSSVEQRLEYYRNAIELFAEHPVIGVGSGGFRSAYESKIRGTQMAAVDNPHNAFLHVGVELGLLGLAVLTAMLLVQWRSAATLGSFTERATARGFVVIVVAASLASSIFDEHSLSLCYAWASGLFFATVSRSRLPSS